MYLEIEMLMVMISNLLLHLVPRLFHSKVVSFLPRALLFLHLSYPYHDDQDNQNNDDDLTIILASAATRKRRVAPPAQRAARTAQPTRIIIIITLMIVMIMIKLVVVMMWVKMTTMWLLEVSVKVTAITKKRYFEVNFGAKNYSG